MNGCDDIMALLAGGGDVGANGCKSLGAFLSAEGAGYFLFDLDHTDVAFRRVIVEWHAEISHKGKHAGFVGLQAVKQVLGWGSVSYTHLTLPTSDLV